MKALSLWQPWASAIALGWKRIETRHWSTHYRGPLAIHAAKHWTAEEREFWAAMWRVEAPDGEDLPVPPLGALVAVARLIDVRRTERLIDTISEQEECWGNYGPDRFGWMLDEIRPLPQPIPFSGHQGLFDIPDDILPAEFRVWERLL